MEVKQPQHESAYIITHKHPFIQPNFLEFPKENKNGADSYPDLTDNCSEIQHAAFDFYDIGLNPFPLPIGKKGGYPWKKLQYTRLDRNHEQYGLFMLFSGDCNLAIMCGRTSRNLFVIDCESPSALQFHTHELQKRNIPLWVSQTQRGGHIYLFSADGEVSNIASGCMIAAEIKGNSGYVLAPPSIHPSQKQYTWLYQEGNEPPTVSIHQIDWLYDKYGNKLCLEAHQSKSITEVKTSKRPYSPLSRRTRDYIYNGHTIMEGSRNNELFSASCDMAGNNFTQQETFNTLFPSASASGLSTYEIDATVKSAFSQPRTPARPTQSHINQIPDWQWAVAFADNHTWSGRSATSKRAIFSALIHRARVSSNDDGLFRASIREIATLARSGTATVQRILKELQATSTPYIVKCGYDKTSQATLWKFPQYIIKKGMQSNSDTLKESPQWLSCSVSVFSLPDAVERNGLGYNGLLIYRVMSMCDKPIFPKELSEMTGLAPHQVKYAMKKLHSFELIVRQDDGWVAHSYDDEELDVKIHEKKNIIGKGQKRARRFARERAIYAGRHLFFVRLRYERDAFKSQVYKTLQQIHHAKYPLCYQAPPPVFREVIIKEAGHRRVIYERITLSELDDDERSLIECALELGAEVIIQETET